MYALIVIIMLLWCGLNTNTAYTYSLRYWWRASYRNTVELVQCVCGKEMKITIWLISIKATKNQQLYVDVCVCVC